MSRRPLPYRRRSETFEIPYGGLSRPHTVTVGYYADDLPGEVFINGGKTGEQVEAIAKDFAVVLSIALQFGVPVDTLWHAVTRDGQGHPMSIGGAVFDKLMEYV
jgi:hypothetical protein